MISYWDPADNAIWWRESSLTDTSDSEIFDLILTPRFHIRTFLYAIQPSPTESLFIPMWFSVMSVFISETPPLRKISVRYVRNIRSKNLTFAVVLRRYRMKVFMFFTKHVSTWQAKLLADLFPSLVGFVFISVCVDPLVPKYRSPKNCHYHTFPHVFGWP